MFVVIVEASPGLLSAPSACIAFELIHAKNPAQSQA
jgi:hypothetical protein